MKMHFRDEFYFLTLIHSLKIICVNVEYHQVGHSFNKYFVGVGFTVLLLNRRYDGVESDKKVCSVYVS